MLVITAIAVVVGVALLLGSPHGGAPGRSAARSGHALRGRRRRRGCRRAARLPGVVPAARARPPGGPIWSNGAVARYGTTPAIFVTTGGLADLRPVMLRFGGYQGPVLVGLGYLGLGVLVVSVVGALVWRHDRRLLLFGAVGLVAAVLSLGPGHGYWVPWQVAGAGPLGRGHRGGPVHPGGHPVRGGDGRSGRRPDRAWARGRRRGRRDRVGAWWSWWSSRRSWPLAPNLPLTTRPVVLPQLVRRRSVRPCRPGRVVLAYPAPFSGLQSSQAWQAVNAMRWAQAGGGGPRASRHGPGRPGPASRCCSARRWPLGPHRCRRRPTWPPSGRHSAWAGDDVVVPDQAGLPVYEQGRSGGYAVGLLTAAIGVGADLRRTRPGCGRRCRAAAPVPMPRSPSPAAPPALSAADPRPGRCPPACSAGR